MTGFFESKDKSSVNTNVIYKTDWNRNNSFNFFINVTDPSNSFYGADKLSSGKSFDDFLSKHFDKINVSVVSITTPDQTSTSIEEFVNGEWKITKSTQEIKRFSVTFKDFVISGQTDIYFDSTSIVDTVSFYNIFERMNNMTTTNYPDEQKLTTIITLVNETTKTQNVVYENNSVFIDSVSNLSLSNTSASQILEFTVNFKTA